MTFAHFNTLDYVKLLVQAKFTEQQAEALNEAQIMAIKAVITQVATPADLQNLRLATQTDLQKLDFKMQAEFQSVRSEMSQLQHQINVTEHRLEKQIKDSESRLQKELTKSIHYNLGINVGLMSLVLGLMTFMLMRNGML